MYSDISMTTGKLQAGPLDVTEPVKDRLERQRDEAQKHLDNINNALAFLEKNPSFENFMDAIRKAGF